MAINAGEYRSTIGLDSLYYATVTDSTGAYTASTPLNLAPAAELSAEPTQSSETQYADDQAYDIMYAEGDTKLTLTVTALPLQTLAAITGRHYASTQGVLYDDCGTPPDCALLFRSLKSDGKYKYFAYLKGRFESPKEAAVTKGDSAEAQTQELVFTAMKTTYAFKVANDTTATLKRMVGDEDITAFSGASWFSTCPPIQYAS